MSSQIWACLVALAIGCSSSSKPPPAVKGKVVVVLTVDWEGAVFSPDGLDALEDLRTRLPDVPLTHFLSAAYFSKATPDPAAVASITQATHPGDQLAMHLHAWRSIAQAAGIAPKLSPSFLTGTDKLLEFPDGDVGFDVDLDAYSVSELRAMLRTSRTLLEQTHLPISKAFRAGGYLVTPKVVQALRDEGYTVDSSALDYHQLDEHEADVLPRRLAAIWPKVDPQTPPWFMEAPGGKLLELPIAAVADFSTPQEIIKIVETAHARLQQAPTRDVFVVLAFHQETADEFAGRIVDAIGKVRARPELSGDLAFMTVDKAADLARAALLAPAK